MSENGGRSDESQKSDDARRSDEGQRADDEDDWAQISNQVIRKRIQNRLAQRKHRKAVKAKLKELERLATSKDSSATTTQPSPAASSGDSSSAAKDHPAGSTELPDVASLDVSMHGGFSLDGSAVHTNYIHHHPHAVYPGIGAALPVLRDVPLTNTFSLPERAGDGSLSPATGNFLVQSYAHTQGMTSATTHAGYHQGLAGEIDSLGRYLDQHRHALECHDMQSHATSSASSWASSDRPNQSTDTSVIPDRIMPNDYVSACGSSVSIGAMSARTPLSEQSTTRLSSASPQLLDVYSSKDLEINREHSFRVASAKPTPGSVSGRRHHTHPSSSTTQVSENHGSNRDNNPATEEPGTLSSRIASAMRTIRSLGFSGIEDLSVQFYTADLQDRPALADAQRISRRRGLPRILAKLREHAKDDWTDWEAQGYREEIVRAAEDILGDECRRFSEEDDARGSKRGRNNVAELKRRYQDELPNLYGLLGVLSLASQQWGDADHTTVIVHAISSLFCGSEYTSARSPRYEI